MVSLGMEFAEAGYTLRSGGANGADTAFETGCKSVNGSMDIFLPWKGFNENTSNLYTYTDVHRQLAKSLYGPRWNHVSQGVHRLMTRNVAQVMGLDFIDNSSFVVCWTPDGCETKESRTSKTGGTGQAIALASALKIPVFNLAKHSRVDDLRTFITTSRLLS